MIDANAEYPKLLHDGVVPKPLPEGSELGELDGFLALFSKPDRHDQLIGRSGLTRKRIEEMNLLRTRIHGNSRAEDDIVVQIAEELERKRVRVSRHLERVRY